MKRVAALGLLTLSACASAGGPALRDDADVRGQLMQADRDFDTAARAKGVEGFKSFLAPDVADLSGEVRGAEAMAKGWTPLLSGQGTTIAWQPTSAGFIESAQVGYTTGRFTWTKGSSVKTGTYTTVWKRMADGSWKVAIDGGSSDCVKCEAAR